MRVVEFKIRECCEDGDFVAVPGTQKWSRVPANVTCKHCGRAWEYERYTDAAGGNDWRYVPSEDEKPVSAPWIHTFTGQKVNPLDVKECQIRIEDIAHALANINRFNGQARHPISVAYHSFNVSMMCDGSDALQGLLHDASEAYLGDVTKWLKGTDAFAAYRAVEDELQRRIYRKFGCSETTSPDVEAADVMMVRLEMSRALNGWEPHHGYPQPTEDELACVAKRIGVWYEMTWRTAERLFLDRFHRLIG